MSMYEKMRLTEKTGTRSETEKMGMDFETENVGTDNRKNGNEYPKKWERSTEKVGFF